MRTIHMPKVNQKNRPFGLPKVNQKNRPFGLKPDIISKIRTARS